LVWTKIKEIMDVIIKRSPFGTLFVADWIKLPFLLLVKILFSRKFVIQNFNNG
jgi:hypothetical protein